MRTFVQVLVLELDETEGDPALWDWAKVIDTPGAALAVPSVEIEPDPSADQIDMLHRLTADYRRAVQDQLGIVEVGA